MSEFMHIFLCAMLKSPEVALQAQFAIKNTFAISQCHNGTTIQIYKTNFQTQKPLLLTCICKYCIYDTLEKHQSKKECELLIVLPIWNSCTER